MYREEGGERGREGGKRKGRRGGAGVADIQCGASSSSLDELMAGKPLQPPIDILGSSSGRAPPPSGFDQGSAGPPVGAPYCLYAGANGIIAVVREQVGAGMGAGMGVVAVVGAVVSGDCGNVARGSASGMLWQR
jgi:hypothetical protein